MQRHVRALGLILCLPLFLVAQSQHTAPAAPAQATTFSERDAIQLLNQIRDGLDSRSQKKILSAFDLSMMDGGTVFKQQLAGFLQQSDIIRIHFNLVETSAEDGRGVAVADVEMEADPRDSNLLPVYKKTRLRFVTEHGPAGWKFTDVQPRSFFSRQP